MTGFLPTYASGDLLGFYTPAGGFMLEAKASDVAKRRGCSLRRLPEVLAEEVERGRLQPTDDPYRWVVLVPIDVQRDEETRISVQCLNETRIARARLAWARRTR